MQAPHLIGDSGLHRRRNPSNEPTSASECTFAKTAVANIAKKKLGSN
jgi:hypothetical protein